MTWNAWLAVAAVNGLISVAAGAFGAHGLKDKVTPEHLIVFETGAQYHMYHALAILAVAWLASRGPTPGVNAAGFAFLFGMIIFSGSLYILALTGVSKLGMITPIGGVSLMVGWACLAYAAIKAVPASAG
jgi:uncharacterized membrane protein YgdD (TMEM256/DUF423 family)